VTAVLYWGCPDVQDRDGLGMGAVVGARFATPYNPSCMVCSICMFRLNQPPQVGMKLR
jgi:hypothetical protein